MSERTILLSKDTLPLFGEIYTGDIMDFDREECVAAGVLTDENEIAALFLSTVEGDTLFIDWLYVREKFRHQGIGTSLLDEMLENIMYSYDVELASVATTEETVKDYFRWRGFVEDKEKSMGIATLTIGDMIDLPASDPKKLRFLKDLSQSELRRLNHYFVTNHDIPVTVDLPIDPKDYLEESAVDFRDNEVYSVLLLREDGDSIFVSYAYANKKDVRSLAGLLHNAKDKLIQKYGPDKTLKIAAVNEKSVALVKKLFNNPEMKTMNLSTKILVWDPARDDVL